MEIAPTLAAWTPELRHRIDDLAAAAGFDTAGVAPASSEANESAARFTAWVDAGHAGEMDFLKRRDENGVLLRSAVRVAIPWARSVIVCAINYNAPAPRSIDPAPNNTGWIARYAWSGKPSETEALIPTDYHDDLIARLRLIESGLQQHTPCETRCYVDTGPIVERNFATKAGIGWIGKNTCVINQSLGSWLLLGVIVTSLPVPETAELVLPAQDRCGTCTRCIDACPTDALVAPRQMDASRCIAYLTIEKKGTIPEPLREPMGRQVFGCDICQDVCPWNRKAPIAHKQGTQPRLELVNPALDWLAQMDAPTFKLHFKGSPLERTKRKRLHRNVAIAMGNSADPQFLPQLNLWSNGDDAVLAETARWAIEKIQSSSILPQTKLFS
nr:tRNA epoxyqueuosine(34) reductase QueG [Granulicella arctica]